MTREEAIKRLDGQAFKELEKKSIDCISRQKAIDALGECPMNWTDSDAEITAERDWKDTVEMLKKLPSVNPQPKTEVIDKIRAEIMKLQTYKMFYGEDTVYIERDDVLEIIDKYKVESEDKK